MPITRSQARSGQPPNRAASLRANPPKKVSSTTSDISQQLPERGVNDSVQEIGGSLAIPLAEGNERPPTTRKCRADCLSCPALIKSKIIISFVTGRKYSAIDIEPIMVHCKIHNYIYLLSCSSCKIQYVGESVINVNLRMNIHRRGKSGCEICINHFKNVCPGSTFTIQILEKLPGNGYINGIVDPEMLEYRLQREDYWIKTLRTVYPYGLNQRTKFMSLNKPIGKLFPALPRYGDRFINNRKRPVHNYNSNPLSLDSFLNMINTFDPSSRANEVRKFLESLKKKDLRKLANDANINMHEATELNKRYCEILIDMFFTKIFKPEPDKIKKVPKFIFPIYFDNKGLDLIQLNKILRQEEVISKLPDSLQKEETPSTV